jgi:hypothetical protein
MKKIFEQQDMQYSIFLVFKSSDKILFLFQTHSESFRIMGAVLSNQTETPLAFRLITKPPFLLVDLDPSTNREEMTRAYATEFQTLRPQHNLPASTFVLIFIEKHLHINHIGGVMVNMFLFRAVDRGLKSRLSKPKTMKLVFVASPLSKE